MYKNREVDTESRMQKVKVAEDVIGNLIKAEIENKTKDIKRHRRRQRAKEQLLKSLTEKNPKKSPNIPPNLKEEDGKFTDDNSDR